MITFEYNGKIYKPSNLENKLKKLGITKDDIKILEDTTDYSKLDDDLTYCQKNHIISYFYTYNNRIILSRLNKKSLQEVHPELHLDYIGSTLNNGVIETIIDAEKRLEIKYDNLLDMQMRRVLMCYPLEENINKGYKA